jgi:hypothetical protein
MRSKFKFGMVAGAVALALSAHAFAVTGVGATGTIFLSLDDVTSQTNYIFDTGLSAQNFAGDTSTAPIDFSSSALTSFLASVTGGNLATTTDTVTFSVIGGASNILSGNTTQTRFVDFTSNNAPNGAGVNGASATGQVAAAYGQINTFLQALANTSGGGSFLSNTQTANQWFQGSNSAAFDSDLVVSNGGLISNSLAFYQETALLPASTNPNGVEKTFAGSWSLNLANDTLNYTAIPTPLPAPLLLLLSGLGAMGIVGRRNRAAA